RLVLAGGVPVPDGILVGSPPRHRRGRATFVTPRLGPPPACEGLSSPADRSIRPLPWHAPCSAPGTMALHRVRFLALFAVLGLAPGTCLAAVASVPGDYPTIQA